MGIHIPVYEIVCDRCGWVIASAPTREEAEEINRTGRDCIVVDGRVYCCEQCECFERKDAK